MTDGNERLEERKEESCVEGTVGLDECVDCGACDHCDSDATLDEAELTPKWIKFIEKSKSSI